MKYAQRKTERRMCHLNISEIKVQVDMPIRKIEIEFLARI